MEQQGFLATHTGDLIVTHTGDAFILERITRAPALALNVDLASAIQALVEFDVVLVLTVNVSATVAPDPINNIIGAITNFKSVRDFDANNAVLSWESGINVDRVDVYRSISQRGTMTKVGDSTTDTFTNTGLTDTDTVSYRVVPINLRDGTKQGKASYIVYNSGSNKIL